MSCELCKKLNKDVQSVPKIEKINCLMGRGKKPSSIMIVSEHPGREDCASKKAFVDKGAREFQKSYCYSAGIKMSSMYCTYAIKCRLLKIHDNKQFKDRKPTPTESRNCRPYLEKEIKQVQPKVIFALGKVAWDMLVGKVGDYNKWESRYVWSNEFNCWVVPMFAMWHIRKVKEQDRYVAEKQLDIFLDAVNKLAKKPRPKPEKMKAVLVRNEQHLEKMFKMIKEEATECVIDIESKTFEPDKHHWSGGLLCVGFCWKDNVGVCVPINLLIQRNYLFKRFLENDNIEKIMHNQPFDQKYLEAVGYEFGDSFIWDTVLMSHLCDENRASHNLKNLAWEYTQWGGYDDELEAFKKKESPKLKRQGKEFTYDMFPKEMLYKYACYDVAVTYKIFNIFKKQMIKEKTMEHYETVIAPTRLVLNEMEKRGALIDKEYVKKRDKKCVKILQLIEHELKKAARAKNLKDYNPSSSKQNIIFLYKVLKLPLQINKDTKQPSGDAKALEVLKKKHIVPNLLLAHHTLSKYRGTYITGFLDRLDGSNRVHTSFLSFGTVTGRISSTNPSVMNIPRDPDIRTMVIAPRGYKIIEADFKQAELMWLAHYSEDEFLLDAFARGLDIHTETGKEVLNKDKITKEERVLAKTVNFGIIYGRQAKSIAEQFNMTEREAQDFIDKTFRKMKGAARWINDVRKQALQYGYVQSFFGRIRRFPNINTLNHYEKEGMLRQAVNSLIQGSAADGTYVALTRVSDYIKEHKLSSRIILTVHDCIVVEAPNREVKLMTQRIQELMEKPILGMKINLKADVEVGDKFGMIEDKDRSEPDKLKITVEKIKQEYQKLKRRK